MDQKIMKSVFGVTRSGEKAFLFQIPNNTNDYIEVSNYGCTIKSIHIHDRNGKLQNVLCGYDSLAEYEASQLGLGAVILENSSCTAHKIWDVQEVGDNYVFFSCVVPAEEWKGNSELTVGARIMWVNLNRIVIDLFLTPKTDAQVNATVNLPFCLTKKWEDAGYMVRTFSSKVLYNGQLMPVSQSPYQNLAFIPLTGESQLFLSSQEEMKPMAELAGSAAGMTISAYSSMTSLNCQVLPEINGVCLNQSLQDNIELKGGETFASRMIYGFDRLYTKEEVETPAMSPFSALI